MSETIRPRILRFEITAQDAGKTIKEYLMRKVGFSSKQLSRFKYRKDGILLNGVKHYVNAVLGENDVLEIRLTQGGEPVEADPRRPGLREGGYQTGGYAAARDGRLQKIWVKPVDWLNSRFPLQILYEDQDILAAFGEEILSEDRTIDRMKLSASRLEEPCLLGLLSRTTIFIVSPSYVFSSCPYFKSRPAARSETAFMDCYHFRRVRKRTKSMIE